MNEIIEIGAQMRQAQKKLFQHPHEKMVDQIQGAGAAI
jgi:hypothetical protein